METTDKTVPQAAAPVFPSAPLDPNEYGPNPNPFNTHHVTLPPYTAAEGTYTPYEPPPAYTPPVQGQQTSNGAAQETGCSICKRYIKKAFGAALMTFIGIAAFAGTIALSPLFGLYIVGGAICQPGCYILPLDSGSAKVLAILFLGAVAIASLPVVFVSPIFAAAAAYHTGKWYFDGDQQLPSFLKDANHLSHYILSSDILRFLFGGEVRHHRCSYPAEVNIRHHHTYRCWGCQ